MTGGKALLLNDARKSDAPLDVRSVYAKRKEKDGWVRRSLSGFEEDPEIVNER